MHKAIAKALLNIREADQKMRSSGAFDRNLDKRHALELKRIISIIGWPNKETVGEKAAEAAWLIAQHADLLPDFQKQCFKLMKVAAARGLADKALLAYLHDRVLVNSGGKQIYRTQWRMDKNTQRMKPWPIRNIKKAEQLRKEMQLPTLKKYGEYLQTQQEKLQLKHPHFISDSTLQELASARRPSSESWSDQELLSVLRKAVKLSPEQLHDLLAACGVKFKKQTHAFDYLCALSEVTDHEKLRSLLSEHKV